MFDLESRDFWNPLELATEEHRVLEICNSCRLCFNLCPFFLDFFRLLDEQDGELGRLSLRELRGLWQLCYLCRLCMVVCPYVPPHEFAIDIPRLVVRIRAVEGREKGIPFRERALADLDRMGSIGCLAPRLANWAGTNRLSRLALKAFLGIHRRKKLPEYKKKVFSDWFKEHQERRTTKAGAGERVVLFPTCYVNYFKPGLGAAAVAILERSGREVVCPPLKCCGMPQLEIGHLKGAQEKVSFNLSSLSRLAKEGCPILVIGPTCTYMIKNDYPLLSRTEEAQLVAKSTYEISDYLAGLAKQGALDRALHPQPGKVLYQVACHLRALGTGYKAREVMALIPELNVETVEACSGADGNWSGRSQYFEASLKVGQRLFERIRATQPARVVTDCPVSALQIEGACQLTVNHPLELLNEAYRP